MAKTVSINIIGNATQAIAALDAVGIKATETAAKTDKVGKAGDSAGGKLSKFGKVAALGLVGVAVASVKMAGDFQSSAEHLVTDAGESQAALAGVQAGMLAISKQTGTSSAEIVNGMYHIESAGFHGAAGLNLLKVAAEGAKVGGASLDTVSKTLTGTMNSFHTPAAQAVNVMNELIATVGSGDMRMEDLASSLGNVGPIAAAAGISLAQVGGAIATMTAQNMSAQQATQDLANTIRSLQAPSAVAVHEMAQFGLNSNDVSTSLGKRGLTGTLQLLTSAITSQMGPAGQVLFNAFNLSTGASKDMTVEMGKMAPATRAVAQELLNGKMTAAEWRAAIKGMPVEQNTLAKQFLNTYNQSHKFNDMLKSGSPAAQTYNAALEKMTGGATGLNTSLMLTGGNMATFTANVKNISDAATKGGKDVDNWAAIQKTFNQRLDVAKAQASALAITIGLKLIPILEKVMTDVAGVISWFGKHKDAATALAIVIGGVLSAAFAAFTINKIAGMIKGLGDAVKALAALERAAAKAATTLLDKFGIMKTASADTAKSMEADSAAAGKGFTGMAGVVGVAATGVYFAFKMLTTNLQKQTDALIAQDQSILQKQGGNLTDAQKQQMANALANVAKSGGPFRAAGGPVSSGTSYMVGEKGPEWFVPSSNGMILPHGAAPGGNGGGRSGGSAVPVVLTLDGQVVARGLWPYIRTQGLQGSRRNATRVGFA